MSTTIPAYLKAKLGDANYILVVKDQLSFLNEEDPNATQEEHSKWWIQHWWKLPAAVIFYDTEKEAMDQGLITPYPYWWIVFDRDGKKIDGGY